MDQEQDVPDDEVLELDTDASGGNAGAARVPPYVAYSTFLTLLKELKENGLPPQLDKSVLKRFAFGIQSQLKMGLRSLSMLDGDKPTPRLKAFVDAYGTDQYPSLLLGVLKEVYPYVFALDLQNATPTMFADAFKSSGAKGEDALRKCRSFFTHAAKDAGVAFGPRLANGTVPRSPSGPRRARKPKAKNDNSGAENPPPPPPPAPNDGILGQLLGKFPDFDPSWPDEIKAKWFAGFDQFMKGAKQK